MGESTTFLWKHHDKVAEEDILLLSRKGDQPDERREHLRLE